MTPEGKVKKKITDWLKTLGCYFFTPIGSMYGRSGVPDIIVCMEGRFIGIEVKAPGRKGTQTPLQKVAEEKIVRAGGQYFLVDSLEELKERFL